MSDLNVICKLTDIDIGEKYNELVEPKVRIGARGIIRRNDGKIAIFNKSNKNEYKLPGGGIKSTELPEDSFKREVLEETGCIVNVVDNIGITEEYKSKQNFKQISHVFIGDVVEDKGYLSLTDIEISTGGRLLWETPERALALITDCYNKITADEFSIYITKFVVLRDRKILEYYINNYLNKNTMNFKK